MAEHTAVSVSCPAPGRIIIVSIVVVLPAYLLSVP